MDKKEILLNAFDMSCVGHINHGLWTHPRDHSTEYKDLNYWTDRAQLLERGLFDGLFVADIVGVYDVFESSIDQTAREAVQLPVNDPLLAISAMAHVTRHLGFGVTVNLTYETPYLFARRMSTLDHLTRGRIGWNIVTGYLESAARAMGLAQQIAHDERYDRADEFLDVVYQLWEGSWRDDAVQRDRAQRLFADPAALRKVAHHGRYYDVEGYHLCEPSIQRTPVLYQAGSSARGQAFAAQHAECVFISNHSVESAAKLVANIRRAAVHAGRRADDVKIFMGVSVIVAPTREQAQEKYAEYVRYANPRAALAHFSSSSGIDLSRFELDEPIRARRNNAIESVAQRVTAEDAGWTVRKLLRQLELGGKYTVILGSPDDVVDQLHDWTARTGLDGFNLARTVVPESIEDFVDLVVPRLQERGLYKTAYRPGSLREKLFGAGPRLPANHPGAQRRQAPAPAASFSPLARRSP